jgi:hypothetical protein
MKLKPNIPYLVEQFLAREKRYMQTGRPTPTPITTFWQEKGYTGSYQLIFPTQQEIALVTKNTDPIDPRILEELHRQDPTRLELTVDSEIGFDLDDLHIMQLILDKKRLGMMTAEQREFTQREFPKLSTLGLDYSPSSNAANN